MSANDEPNGQFLDLKLEAKVFQEATQLIDPLPDPKPLSPDDPAPLPVIKGSRWRKFNARALSRAINFCSKQECNGCPLQDTFALHPQNEEKSKQIELSGKTWAPAEDITENYQTSSLKYQKILHQS